MSLPLLFADLPTVALAWLLTYLIHSTLLLSAAWLVSVWLAGRWAALEQLVWRGALFAGLLTASVPAGLGWSPLLGRWELAESQRPAERATGEELRPVPLAMPAEAVRAPRVDEAANRPIDRALESLPARPAVVPPVLPTSPAADRTVWSQWLVGGWLASMVLGLAAFALAWTFLCRRLARHRREIVEGPLAEMLARLVRRADCRRPVRLWCSPEIEGPLAYGFWRPQICLPERALTELSLLQQQAMLAHELAHIVRNDPAWAAASRLIECVLFVQPLNRLARRKLEDAAEHLADAWAAEQTGEGLTLAGLLVEVAGWIVSPGTPVAASGMASQISPLARRVHRLLDGRRERSARPVAVLLLVACIATLVALTAPGVAAVGAPASPVREPVPVRRLADPGIVIETRIPETPVAVREPPVPVAPAEAPVARRRAAEPRPPRAGREDLDTALGALDADLASLAEEVAELEELLRESPDNARRFAPILGRLARQVKQLAARRDALRTLAPGGPRPDPSRP